MANTKITVTFDPNGIQVDFNQLDGLTPGLLERAYEKVQRAFFEANARAHQLRARTEKEETARAQKAREKKEAEARTKAMNDAAAEAAKAASA